MKARAQLSDRIVPAVVLVSLLRLAEQKQLDPERLLRGTRLFYSDLALSDARVSPLQCLQVIKKLCRALNHEPALAFEWGQRLCLEQPLIWFKLWRHAGHLQHALRLWGRYYPLFQPLLQLRVDRHQGKLYLRLCSAVSLGTQQRFVFEAALAALRQLLREQLGGDTWMRIELPWAQLSDDFHSSIYLGERVVFSSNQCVLVLSESSLFKPFAESSALTRALLLTQARADLRRLPQRELMQSCLRRLIRRRIKEPLTLEQAADFLGLSATTLKRRLKEEGTHFKGVVDEERANEALHLMACRQLNNRQLAARMAFADEHSFRRAFKRWTGAIPSHYRTS